MSTPRTDAESARLYGGKFNMLEIAEALEAHARQLETELAARDATIAGLRDALKDIAEQKTSEELYACHVAMTEDFGVHDFEDGYDKCVLAARSALAQVPPPKPDAGQARTDGGVT